jgi:hypothetical protein
MANSIEALREQAARLFALALEARDKGNFELADLMTAAATRQLDRAEELESAAPPPSPQQQQQPAAQQQQQVQPDDPDKASGSE